MKEADRINQRKSVYRVGFKCLLQLIHEDHHQTAACKIRQLGAYIVKPLLALVEPDSILWTLQLAFYEDKKEVDKQVGAGEL